MYRLFYFFLLSHSVPLLAQRISPPKPVVMKVTATWCNVCGLNPWDDFKFIAEEFEQDAVILAVHADDLSQLHNPTAGALANNLPDRLGQPELFLDGEYVEDSWISGTRDYIKATQLKEPIAHVFLTHEIIENRIHATATIEFLKDSNKEHYMGLYVVENQVTAFQNSRGPEDRHSKVLRAHFRESPFGTLLTDSEIKQGTILEAQYSMKIDTAWNANHLELAAIIWEKSGDHYFVTNANTSLTPSFYTFIPPTLLANVQLDIRPTVVEENAVIQFFTTSALASAQIDILSLNGSIISSIYQGAINSGNTTFALPLPTALSNGVYLIQVRADGGSLVRKFVLKK